MAKDTRTQLYRHFDSEGNLLYVGISLSAVARLCQHRDKSEWFRDIARVEIESFDRREDAEAAETEAIRVELPRHNQMKTNYSPSEKVLRLFRKIGAREEQAQWARNNRTEFYRFYGWLFSPK